MTSEVEKNQNIVTVGDNLIYSDTHNMQTWVVVELIEGGFIAYNRELAEQDECDGSDLFLFSDLQIGWEFTSRTRQNKKVVI